MADQITILGGAPTVALPGTNWTQALKRPQLVSWTTADDPALTLVAGRITAMAPRTGAGLVKSADSAGPVRELRDGMAVGKYATGVLNYLHAPITVDSASFSMAAVVYIDAYTVQGRDLMAVFKTSNSMRVTRNNGKYGVRVGISEYLVTAAEYSQTGWHLIVWSQNGGSAALRVQRIGGTPELVRAANAITVGSVCTPIFGADEIANGEVGAAPNAGRAWSDCICEQMVWSGVDMLASGESEYLATLTGYFDAVYGAAA